MVPWTTLGEEKFGSMCENSWFRKTGSPVVKRSGRTSTRRYLGSLNTYDFIVRSYVVSRGVVNPRIGFGLASAFRDTRLIMKRGVNRGEIRSRDTRRESNFCPRIFSGQFSATTTITTTTLGKRIGKISSPCTHGVRSGSVLVGNDLDPAHQGLV